MAYINIAEWSPDQVADWLKGLNGVIAPYISLFLAKNIKGHQLLFLRTDDLNTLGIHTIGHQELILEAVEHLRNFHYELDRENLQQLAMRLSCVATSLYNELRQHQDNNKVDTQTLSDVAHIIAAVKPLVCWLDRSPFMEQLEYSERKSALLKLSLEAATCAQRERFAERPTHAIAAACRQLAALADYIIQDVSDPMVLQPSSLDLVVLKKKDHHLGFDIVPSFSGHHQIANIKFGSPAHASGKIEEGDEIVQVNYQTVIGWCPKSARLACINERLNNASTIATQNNDLVLTLRRRPAARATVLAAPQFRPYRPIKRNWAGITGNTLMPNRVRMWDKDMLALRFRVLSVEPEREAEAGGDSSSDESEVLSPPSSPTTLDQMSSPKRLYLPKPRTLVQRRNTISGSSPISKRPNVSIEQFWQELENHKSLNHTGSAQMSSAHDHDEISNNLKTRPDKAISCSTFLEFTPRPKTCLGVRLNHATDGQTQTASNKWNKPFNNFNFDGIPPTDHNQTENVNEQLGTDLKIDLNKSRGKLDKSHSTPAYDFGNNTNDEAESLVTQVIPESPTTPTESPTIIVHSAEKVDQILDFKKSSNQIGEAILLHHIKHDKVKPISAEVTKTNLKSEWDEKLEVNSKHLTDVLKPSSEVTPVFETVNMAMPQFSKEDGCRKTSHFSPKSQSIFYTEFGDKSSNSPTQNLRDIQNELVEAINEKCFVTPILVPSKPKISDLPPEPPPRPLSTQKPGFTTRDCHLPTKENRTRHITKQDIQVVPNVDMNPPVLPTRRDIPLPLSPSISMTLGQISQLSYDMKHSNSNLSHSDLSTPKTPLMQARSLQKLEVDSKSVVHSPPKLDFSNIKPSQFETSKMLSPTNSVVRGIFPSAKSKSLKKKNSILAKRRKVSVKEVSPGEIHGWLYQRCRTKSTSVIWRQKWYILTSNTLYGYKNKEATRADCLIFLNGFTVSPAQEVKSKPFSFKVYHTGTVFYFAVESADAMNMWYEYISRATLLNYDSWERAHKKDAKTDESKHFSETDYSDEDLFQDSDKSKHTENKNEKSKFGSLKKFTNRIHKTESQESVSHASTSLDRKYLRIFSSKYGSNKSKDEKLKAKHSDPVPTEQYRSYRKIPTSPQHASANVGYSASPTKLHHENKDNVAQNVAKIKKLGSIDNKTTNITSTSSVIKKQQKKIPKPINYIHASNPNLLDFEKIDFIAKPSMNAPSFKPKIPRSENVMGFVTLEQFMLKKQEEERRQVFSNRVLMGIEKDSRAEEKGGSGKSARDTNNLQKQLDKIVPDVIYGEIPQFNENVLQTVLGDQIQNRSLPKTPDTLGAQDNKLITATHHEYVHIPDDIKTTNTQKNLNDNSKPISIKGRDGYEKIVYGVSPNDIIYNENDNLESFSALPQKPSLKKKKECELARHEVEVASECSESGLKISSGFTPDSEHKSHIETKSIFSDFLSDTGASSRNISPSESSRDLGYETIYGEKCDDSVSKLSGLASVSSILSDEAKMYQSTDGVGGTLPPKIMPKSKQVLNRQNSLTSSTKSGPDTNPVFLQGESPEKFWLNSLRRNDKVFSTTNTDNGTPRNEKFFTKRTEPSAFMKSSEATIVKSDKAHKAACVGEHSQQLKSATQYKPMSLPFVSPNKSLKTSPQFELMLDAKVMPVASGISRLRQIFQHSSASNKSSRTTSPTGSVKEKTILGSPRLHRTIFRKQHGSFHQPADGWTQDLSYSKASSSNIASPDSTAGSEPSDTVLDVSSSPGSCDVSSMSNMSTPDYPHLEYPPVFEPEIYCLSDPNTSLNLLSKKSNQFERE